MELFAIDVVSVVEVAVVSSIVVVAVVVRSAVFSIVVVVAVIVAVVAVAVKTVVAIVVESGSCGELLVGAFCVDAPPLLVAALVPLLAVVARCLHGPLLQLHSPAVVGLLLSISCTCRLHLFDAAP